ICCGVACGSTNRVRPTISSSTTLVMVTSPTFHCAAATPSSQHCYVVFSLLRRAPPVVQDTPMFDAIIFAGGGNRCYWQGGFYEATADRLGTPSLAVGVSAGAFACI